MKQFLALVIVSSLLGCVSVQEARLDDGSLSVEIADSGWYLFGFIPIVTGDPVGFGPNWFTDDVNPQTTLNQLDRILAREQATRVGPIVTREVDESLLVISSIKTYRTSAIIPRTAAQPLK